MRQGIALLAAAISLQLPFGRNHDNVEKLDTDREECGECVWRLPSGVLYNLTQLCQSMHKVRLSQPKDAVIEFGICRDVECGENKSAACIHVPGLSPSLAAGSADATRFKPLEENAPGKGLLLALNDGSPCEASRSKNRSTRVQLKCSEEEDTMAAEMTAFEAWEGRGKGICEYTIELSSPLACPRLEVGSRPKVFAVSGCIDTSPIESTTNCSAAGGVTVTLHGVGLKLLASGSMIVRVGTKSCQHPRVISDSELQCMIPAGEGRAMAVSLRGKTKGADSYEEVLVSVKATVSYKKAIDFKSAFESLEAFGVGGLKKQANEIYTRVFMTRNVPMNVLKELRISHVKGVVLYGLPGTGKTLLARTVARIMGNSKVQLVNAPELLNKYIGESERSLRDVFNPAEVDWTLYGTNSDYHTVIIDEIDAICKPRGRHVDNPGSLTYDSLVNQLLTQMDGLREMDNVLVIGLTNRIELIDSALLRPGRFEVLVKMGLPEEEERLQIISVLTHDMSISGRLHPDVDLADLASKSGGLTGADLAAVVRQAAAFALQRSEAAFEEVVVESEDFLRALTASSPKANNCAVTCECHTPRSSHLNWIPWSPNYTGLLAKAELALDGLLRTGEGDSIHLGMLLVALIGGRGSGKTTTLAHLASYASAGGGRRKEAVKVMHLSLQEVQDTETVNSCLLRISRTIESESLTAIFIDDLCHTLGTCGQGAGQTVKGLSYADEFLLTLKSIHLPKGARLAVVVACSDSCWPTYFPHHFDLVLRLPSMSRDEARGFLRLFVDRDTVAAMPESVVQDLPRTPGELALVADCLRAREESCKMTDCQQSCWMQYSSQAVCSVT